MYAGMTNDQRNQLEAEILARRALKAAGKLPKVKQAKGPHERGENRPASWLPGDPTPTKPYSEMSESEQQSWDAQVASSRKKVS